METCLFVDHACNLRCRYCYNGEHFCRPMPLSLARQAVDLALSSRPPLLDLSFFGGEPLLHLDWIREVVEYAEHRVRELAEPTTQLRFVMNTNATLLAEAALDCMSPPRPFAVFASLDGDQETHDRFRVDAHGQGTHARVTEGIARLRARNIPFELVAVVGADAARAVGRTVRALWGRGSRRITLSPNFRDAWTDEHIAELREGLVEACDFWIDRFRAGETAQIEPLHTKILTHLHGGSPCPARCLLGQSEWAMAPSGNLYPCAQMVGEDTSQEWVIGHIDKGFDLARIRELGEMKRRVEPTCAPCELRDRCQSHCGCRHIALTGTLGEINAVLCEVELAFVEAADRVAETLWRERCPAFVQYYYERPWRPAAGSRLLPLRRRPS